jgi:hypothetical protein
MLIAMASSRSGPLRFVDELDAGVDVHLPVDRIAELDDDPAGQALRSLDVDARRVPVDEAPPARRRAAICERRVYRRKGST